MRNKKLLVIGAGLAQVDAIKKAKELGLYVLASDGSKDAPGLSIAYKSKVIDVKDVEGNLSWAREEKIDGVISYASDITLPAVLGIREAMNLPGLGRIPMEVSLNKLKQRICFKTKNLPQPDFAPVKNVKDIKVFINSYGYPVVIKPVDNSGSRGVSVISSQDDIEKACTSALENSKNKDLIIEGFMEGTELTVEGFTVNGKHHILAISDKYKPQGSYRVATQLAYPADISKVKEKEIVSLMEKALDAAKVDNSPTHSEIILTKQGPKLVEIACRGGGFYIFTRVVKEVSGYDVVANWTKMCLNEPIDPVRIIRRGVVLKFFAADPGRFVRVTGLKEAKALEGVETDLFLKPGDIIPELKTDGSRTGWIIARGKDRKEALRRAQKVCDIVRFETEPVL